MDKLRRTYPLSIVFATGELPTAAKLSGISTQSRNALGIIERAIGDIWNQAGDTILSPSSSITGNALHITNIGRSIGRMSLLNQVIPGVRSSIELYDDDIMSSEYAGQTQGWLHYAPASGTTFTLAGTVSPLVQGQEKASPYEVDTAGDWHIDTTGKLYSFSKIPIGLRVKYKPSITPDVNTTQSWNIIPDPSTWSGNYQGVKISFANDTNNSTGYHIWLPPRKPMNSSTRIFSKSPSDNNDNTTATPDTGSKVFFQDTASDAALVNAIHYRYNFPSELVNGTAGEIIPEGAIYLWDEQTGTIIEGCSYFVPADSAHKAFKIRVTGSDLPNVFGTIKVGVPTATDSITDDDTHSPTDYVSRFKVIVPGATVAQSLARLTRLFFDHTHRNIESSLLPVSHDELADVLTPPYDVDINPDYPSAVPSFPPSRWLHDSHPQYLHRGGSTDGDIATSRDAYDNAVFNQFILSHTDLLLAKLYLKIISGTEVNIYPDVSSVMKIGNANQDAYLEFNQTGAGSTWIKGTTPMGAISNETFALSCRALYHGFLQ